jgi:hypothetical protein
MPLLRRGHHPLCTENKFNSVSPSIRNSVAAVLDSSVILQDILIKNLGNRTPLVGRGEVFSVNPKSDDPFSQKFRRFNGGPEVVIVSQAGKEEAEKPFVVIVPDQPRPVP